MNSQNQLTADIRLARWLLKDLKEDPSINFEEIRWVSWMLRKLETQRSQVELWGFDNTPFNQNYLAIMISEN